MADLTLTVAEVLDTGAPDVQTGLAGVAITAGQPLYKDATDSDKLTLADANAAASAACVGLALHATLAGQPVKYQTAGPFTIGATAAMKVGEIYIVSDTAGGIKPRADLATGEFTTVLGITTSAAVLFLKITVGGVAKAA